MTRTHTLALAGLPAAISNGAFVPFAVLSVGGFLGVGEKHVVVPAKSIKVTNGKIVIEGAAKASLSALPDDKFTK